jgi:hypothetical protein
VNAIRGRANKHNKTPAAEGMQSAENPVRYTTRIESVACLFDALEALHEALACFKAGAVRTRD